MHARRPELYDAVLASCNDTDALYELVTYTDTVHGALVSLFINHKVLAIAVGRDLAQARTEKDIRLDTVT